MADEVVDRTKQEIPGPTTSKGDITPVDVDVLPSYEVEGVDLNYSKMLAQFRERANFIKGVTREALSHTKPQHWLARRQKNGNVTYSLLAPGAERIRSIVPIGFVNLTRREETWTKEIGPGYTIYREGEVWVGSPRVGTLPCVGSCSSDSDFWSTEHVDMPYVDTNPEHKASLASGEGRLSNDGKTLYIRRRIPANEIDKSMLEKASLSNFFVNAISRVLGIRAISEEELKDVGIDIGKIPGFEYGSTKAASGQLAPAEQQKKDEIKKWLVEMNGGDEAKALAELKSRTAFRSNEPGGRDYPGCESWERMTVKQVANHHPRVKADYDAFREGRPEQPEKAQGAQKSGSGAGVKPSGGKSGSAPGGQATLL
jgi:hypothetical protein